MANLLMYVPKSTVKDLKHLFFLLTLAAAYHTLPVALFSYTGSITTWTTPETQSTTLDEDT
jgi:hypothetical protein